VQHATGGTVAKIVVKDGDRVEQGAILLELDETITRANLQIITKQLDELAVRKMRLMAERDGAEALPAPSSLQSRLAESDVAALVAAERRLYESRREGRMGQKAQLRERIAQLRQEADGLAAQQWAKGNEINLVGKELEGAEKLWERKLIPIAKFTALQREAARLEGERAQLRSQHAQTKGRITETELQIIQLDQDLRTEVVPEGGSFGDRETALIADLTQRVAAYQAAMEAIEVRKAATELRAIWVTGNEYLQAAAPWSVHKTDPQAAAAMVRLSLNLIRLYAVLSAPFIPDAAEAMLDAVGAADAAWPEDVATALDALPPGHAFTTPDVLFAKISDEEREDWQKRFAGVRS
jgi:multidrug efflux pump subunit AcrA (membrane-fusion protein)